jgi:hypothetical protein
MKKSRKSSRRWQKPKEARPEDQRQTSLFCKGQKAVTDEYRAGYDRIRWDN